MRERCERNRREIRKLRRLSFVAKDCDSAFRNKVQQGLASLVFGVIMSIKIARFGVHKAFLQSGLASRRPWAMGALRWGINFHYFPDF